MRSLFSPLFCLVVVRNNCEEIRENAEEEKRQTAEEGIFWFFGFLFLPHFGRTFSLSFFLSLVLLSLSHHQSFLGRKKHADAHHLTHTSRMRRGKLVAELCFGGGNKSFVVSVVVSRFFLLERRSSLKKTRDSYVHLRRPHPALKNAFRTLTSAAAAATTDTTTATVCGFDCSRSLGDIGRRETRRKTHSASMAWTKDMNENEEKIEVPEGLKLNAVRMVKTAYETCAKANNYETKEKGQEEMPNVISEATAQQFVRERIESAARATTEDEESI